MKFLISSVLSGFILFTFPGCSNAIDVTAQDVTKFISSLESEKEGIAKIGSLASLATVVENLATGEITDNTEIRKKLEEELDKLAVTSPTIKSKKKQLVSAAEKYIQTHRNKTPTGNTSTPVSGEEIEQTKADLQKIASYLNFVKWYQGDASDGATEALSAAGLSLGDFGSNAAKKEFIIQSPYFWISFWNGYEQQKNTNDSTLDATTIKKIFKKATEIKNDESNKDKKGLKLFIEAILAFATEASESTSISTLQKTKITVAIKSLQKGDSATNVVTNLENLILHCLLYSINKKLEACNIVSNPNTGELSFRHEIFTYGGDLKTGFKGTEEITKLVGEAIRGITILRGSINKVMIPTLPGGKYNVAEATTTKEKILKRLDGFNKLLANIFEVKSTFSVHHAQPTGGGSGTYCVLTQEEIKKINLENTKFHQNNPFVGENEILEGGNSSFLNSIYSTTSTNSLIPLLITTSSEAATK